MRRKLGALPVSSAFLFILSGCASHSSCVCAVPTPPVRTYASYTAWGDSLTQGCEDGTQPYCSYPAELGKLLGVTVNNEGIGGQTSEQIGVRMGVLPSYVTDAFTIPASGSVTGVTFKTGSAPTPFT